MSSLHKEGVNMRILCVCLLASAGMAAEPGPHAALMDGGDPTLCHAIDYDGECVRESAPLYLLSPPVVRDTGNMNETVVDVFDTGISQEDETQVTVDEITRSFAIDLRRAGAVIAAFAGLLMVPFVPVGLLVLWALERRGARLRAQDLM